MSDNKVIPLKIGALDVINHDKVKELNDQHIKQHQEGVATAQSVFDDIRNGFNNLGHQINHNANPQEIVNQISNKINGAIHGIENEIHKINTTLSGSVVGLRKEFTDMGHNLQTGFNGAIHTVETEINGIPAKVKVYADEALAKAAQGFHSLTDELKHQALRASVKEIAKKLGEVANLATGFWPNNVGLGLPVITIGLTGISTQQDGGKTAISTALTHAANTSELEWKYQPIHDYIVGFTKTGLDLTLDVAVQFELPIFTTVQIGIQAGWSAVNVIQAVDQVLVYAGVGK